MAFSCGFRWRVVLGPVTFSIVHAFDDESILSVQERRSFVVELTANA
jgi:hypothetical protein